MNMTTEQRADLAQRIEGERYRRFGGSRLAMYTAAGLNSATWARLEAGESVKERSVVKAVKLLWPDSGGDWTRLNPPLSVADDSDAELIAAVQALPKATTEQKAWIIERLREESRAARKPGDEGVKGA